jgi:hypothetical protein
MVNSGTQEQKRLRKAVPPTVERKLPTGCLIAIGAYLVVCAALFMVTRSRVVVVFALPVVAGVGWSVTRFLYSVALLIAVRLRWTSRGIRCLMVYSDSPNWAAHIESRWVPAFGHVAVPLNWSERASWQPTLAVRLFRRFCGQRENFNPAVVVFRGLRQPQVFRFYYAFQQVKVGRGEYLHRLESELLRALGKDTV